MRSFDCFISAGGLVVNYLGKTVRITRTDTGFRCEPLGPKPGEVWYYGRVAPGAAGWVVSWDVPQTGKVGDSVVGAITTKLPPHEGDDAEAARRIDFSIGGI